MLETEKNVLDLKEERKKKIPELKEILAQEPDIRAFFRFVQLHGLREEALDLLEARRTLLN